MSDLEKAARMALEALEYYQRRKIEWDYSDDAAITTLRQALEQTQDEWLTGCPECGMDGECGCDKQPAEQEPVGEVCRHGRDSHGREWHGIHWYDANVDVPHGTKLYISPQRKPWQGLTDGEIAETCGFGEHTTTSTCITFTHLARAIEAKLKEKNT